MKCEGLYGDGCIWIRKDLMNARKACILAEEIGHYETTYGDITNTKVISNAKQEHKARIWAYKKIVPITDILASIGIGCSRPDEIAEYLGVDEVFLRDCLKYYNLLD